MSELEELQLKNVLEALKTNLELALSQAKSIDTLSEQKELKQAIELALKELKQ